MQGLANSQEKVRENMLKKVTIYTDGACSGNPGPGGWGAILMYLDTEKEIAGYCENTTNNRMEMTACLEALKCLKERCEVTIYTDSAYVFHAFEAGWLMNWQRNGWRKADKKPVENVDLWKALLAETNKHTIAFVKVKGHADNVYNNRCDKLATGAIKAHQKSVSS